MLSCNHIIDTTNYVEFDIAQHMENFQKFKQNEPKAYSYSYILQYYDGTQSSERVFVLNGTIDSVLPDQFKSVRSGSQRDWLLMDSYL